MKKAESFSYKKGVAEMGRPFLVSNGNIPGCPVNESLIHGAIH